jgi:hypothetical protein
LLDANTFSISFRWDAPEAVPPEKFKTYYIYLGESLTPVSVGVETTRVLSGLKPDTAYAVCIRAVDQAGNLSLPLEQVWSTLAFAPPTNLIVSETPTTCRIALTWNEPTVATSLLGYRLSLNSAPVPDMVFGTSHAFNGLKPDTNYAISVSAVDGAGNVSQPATVTQRTVKFNPPTGFKVLSYTTCEANLSWGPPTSVPVFSGYKIFVNAEPEPLAVIEHPSLLTHSLFPLKNNTPHTINLYAYDAAGNLSPKTSKTITTRTIGPPRNLRAVASSPTRITLTWQPPDGNLLGLSGYAVSYWNGKADIPVGATNASTLKFTVDGLMPETVFGFSVRALDAAGNLFPPATAESTTIGTTAATILYEFNDDSWNRRVALFDDSGDPGGNFSSFPGGMEAMLVYNDRGGTALLLDSSIPAGVGPSPVDPIHWGRRFVLETRIFPDPESTGELTLVHSVPAVATNRSIDWKALEDGRISLALPTSPGFSAVTKDPVLLRSSWTSLQAVVNADRKSPAEVLRLYGDGNPVESLYFFNGHPIGDPYDDSDPDFLQAISGMETSYAETGYLIRSASHSLRADFVRFRIRENFEVFDPSTFHDGEVFEEIDENASATILFDPETLLKRVKNPPSDFVNGVPAGNPVIQFDDDPDEGSIFYGMFRVEFALEIEKYQGQIIVDLKIRRPGETEFRKFGEVTVDTDDQPATGGGAWIQHHYWDSRKPAYEWTTEDAKPYFTGETVQFQMSIR